MSNATLATNVGETEGLCLMLHWQQKAEFFTETGNKYTTLLRWRIGFEPVMSNSAKLHA